MIPWIVEISKYSGVPGVILYLLLMSRYKGIARLLFLVLLTSLLADIAVHFYIRNVQSNSYVISNIWYLLNYLLVTFLFYKLIPSRTRLVSILLIVFCIGSIVSFIFFYSFFDSNTFIKTFSSISFIVLSLTGYIAMLEKPSGRLSKSPVFWILNAIFIYSCITLLKNLFAQYLIFDLQVSRDLFIAIGYINIIANILKNLIFFYALILIRRSLSSYPKTASA